MKNQSFLKSLSALLSLATGGLLASSGKADAATIAPQSNTLEARIRTVNERITQFNPELALGQGEADSGRANEMRWGNWRNGGWGPGRWNNWRNGGWNNWRNGWGNRPWGNWFNR